MHSPYFVALKRMILNTSQHGNSSLQARNKKNWTKEVLLYEIEERRSIILAKFSNTTSNATKQSE